MSNSSTSRYERENRRYQRTAQIMISGSKCRHLNSAGRGLIMGYTAAYQTCSLSFRNTASYLDYLRLKLHGVMDQTGLVLPVQPHPHDLLLHFVLQSTHTRKSSWLARLWMVQQVDRSSLALRLERLVPNREGRS